jgi:ABC-2 type transport system ATP-binding protein
VANGSANAIEVHNLVKRFGTFVAVNHLDLTVRRGELLSVLGPNGAGKSTTLRILTTLMPATEGRIVICGLEVPRDNDRIKPLLGLAPQEIALYERLTPRGNLRFFGRLYGLGGRDLEQRIDAVLEAVELADRADDPVDTLSGGMQRRVNIAAALVHDPEVVFLDEPTVGLDPVTRDAIWKILERLKARGTTLLLTTHYMEEAEALSDRVAIVDHGKLLVIGTTTELIKATGLQTLLRLTVAGAAAACEKPLQGFPEVRQLGLDGNQVRVYTDAGSRLLPALLQSLINAGIEVRSVEVTVPNLGAVFLHYAGRELMEKEPASAGAGDGQPGGPR